MSFRGNIFGQRKETGEIQVSAPNYINTSGLLYGYSFRQLHASATLCCRVTVGAATQDFGFINGYVDWKGIKNFVSPASTGLVQFYNQVDNTLKLVTSPTGTPIISTNGELKIYEKKLYADFSGAQAIANNTIYPTSVNVLKVSRAETKASYMIASSNGWIGAMQPGSTASPTASTGSPTYWKNGSQITPTTRGALYAAITQQFIQHSVKNANLSSWTYYRTGYTNMSAFYPVEVFMEELHFDGVIQTAQDLIDTEQNQINFYL